MAKNNPPGDGHRIGAVRQRSQTATPSGHYVKRDTATGRFLEVKTSDTDDFIYERSAPGKVRLKLGVAYCLRRFQPLVQQLARSHWVDHVKGNRRNHTILGDADDLEEFLFETPRQSLVLLGAELRKLEGGRCFYCGVGMTSVDVDHFVPFSHYPRDLAHNFVLAHPTCNRSKSDTLAAKVHLERWLQRTARWSGQLAEIGHKAGMVADAVVCRRVATWDYTSTAAVGGNAWIASRTFELVDESYLGLLEGVT